uniref:Clink n=1 Tax=Subterranean clover stunt virus TaxID=36772 RepID=A0A345G0H2_SCSV|nr:Clink [Subterranean clover stunt virus]
MALRYFSQLPEELKEKIMNEHLKEIKKKEFLENSIKAACAVSEGLTKKESVEEDDILRFSGFLEGLSAYYAEATKKKCLVRWKKSVAINLKWRVMEEMHYKLYGFADMEDLYCSELGFPNYGEDDVAYHDGAIVNCNQLEVVLDDLGIEFMSIVIDRGSIKIEL